MMFGGKLTAQKLFAFMVSLMLALAHSNASYSALEDLKPIEQVFDLNQKAVELSLEDTVRLAVLQSLNIEILDLASQAEATEIEKAKSIYDTTLESSFQYEHDSAQQASAVFGNRRVTGTATVSLSKKLPTGTDIDVSFGEVRQSTNSSFATLNPNYTSAGTIRITQPLLKNGFGFIDRSEIKLVKIDVAHFSNEVRQNIENTVSDILNVYWLLVMNQRLVEAQRQALGVAQEFLKITEDKFSFGLAEEAELYAAEANVRAKWRDLLAAQLELETRIGNLRILLSVPEDERLIPTAAPDLVSSDPDLEQALANAFTYRQDYINKRLELKASDITLAVSKNSLWPEIDLEGSYTSNGLDRDHKNSAAEVFEVNHPTYLGLIKLRFPLENRFARAEHRKAKLQKESKILELKQLELAIKQEIKDQVRAVRISYEEAKQSAEILRLHEKKLDEETNDFKNGRSSAKTIIDYQDDLIEASRKEAIDLVDYERAQVELLRREGALLKELNISEPYETPVWA